MSKYAFYPGCSLHSIAKEYDLSARAVARELAIGLSDLADWNCCGGLVENTLDRRLDLALNARNLNLAAETGMDLVTPCAICFNRLVSARQDLMNNHLVRSEVADILGFSLNLSSQPKHLLEIFSLQPVLDKLQSLAEKSLSGLRVVAYYGCMLVNLSGTVLFDDPENPKSLDSLVSAMGGEPLPWPYKTECCGGSTADKLENSLTERLLQMAVECGADCIVTACPVCQSNLDFRQQTQRSYNMPVLFFTQLMALVLGIDEKSTGLKRLFVDPGPVLRRVGLIK